MSLTHILWLGTSAHSAALAITDVESGLLWLRSTFLYARITKNPSHYALGSVKTSPEARLEEICVDAIKELVDSGVVDKQDNTLVSNRAFRASSLSPRKTSSDDSTSSRARRGTALCISRCLEVASR